MVKVFYNGQAGNNLFQYFLGRCISEEKNYRMEYGFTNKQPNTVKIKDNFFIFNGLKLPLTITGKTISSPTIEFNKHLFDWETIEKGEYNIILKGYFQNYKYFREYKNFIKKEIYKNNDIFNITDIPDKKDIVLHLRLRDYPYPTPLKFYTDILENEDFKDAWIITDNAKHAHIKILQKKYNCKLKNLSPEHGFLFLANANKIIMSQSTFSWWAAFISKATIIYFPTINDYKLNALWYTKSKRNIDLLVNDEERYVNIKI